MPTCLQFDVEQGVSRANGEGPLNQAYHTRFLVGDWHERVPIGHETSECWLPVDRRGEDIPRSGLQRALDRSLYDRERKQCSYTSIGLAVSITED